jgi:hypothetical protein
MPTASFIDHVHSMQTGTFLPEKCRYKIIFDFQCGDQAMVFNTVSLSHFQSTHPGPAGVHIYIPGERRHRKSFDAFVVSGEVMQPVDRRQD